MKRSTKKGFTIVELVIVIAIIAILAAVLIPTFASLIQKANTSADIQAVREMNTFLAINEVEEPKTINEVFKALENGGMTVKDYHPLVSGRFFFWDSKLNRVLYTDADYKVIFPEDYKSETKENGWLSLSGEIREDNSYKDSYNSETNTVTIKSAEQYYAFAKANKSITQNIKFDAETIDLMGADVGFEIKNAGTYTISGASGRTTIKGLAQLKNNYVGDAGDNTGKDYASGLVQVIDGSNVTVTISNITISGGTFGDLETGGVAAVVGRVQNGATVVFDKVTVENTIINGRNKVGVLVGQLMTAAKIEVKNCKIDKVTVNCSEGEAGKVVGCMTHSTSATFDKVFDSWVTDVTLNLVEGKYSRKTVTLATGSTVKVGSDEMTTDATLVVEKLKADGTASGYRLFFKDAYITALYDNNEKTITVNNKESKVEKKGDWQSQTATIGGTRYNNVVVSTCYNG